MTPDMSNDEQQAALEARPSANEPAALVVQLLTAIRELTIVPMPGADDEARGESALFFPVVGLALGAVALAVSDGLPAAMPSTVRAMLLVGVLAVLSGGRHLGGVARTATAPGCGNDGAIRARGVAVAAALLLAQISVLAGLTGGALIAGLLFAPTLSRWSMVAFAFGSRTVRGGTADDLALRGMKFREFAGASVMALGVTLTYTEAWGLVVILAVGVFAIGSRVVAHSVWGGVTRPLVDTVGVCNETIALGMFALANG